MKFSVINTSINGLAMLQIEEVLNGWIQISHKPFIENHIIKIEMVGSKSWRN